MPNIEFSYTVAGYHFRCEHIFPGGTAPSQELIASYPKKHPVGGKVKVHYDPARPERATLEPGSGRDDWMILALGIIATIFGAAFMLFGGQHGGPG